MLTQQEAQEHAKNLSQRISKAVVIKRKKAKQEKRVCDNVLDILDKIENTFHSTNNKQDKTLCLMLIIALHKFSVFEEIEENSQDSYSTIMALSESLSELSYDEKSETDIYTEDLERFFFKHNELHIAI